MKTMIIEARYVSDPGRKERYSGLVDGINDIVLGIAHRFSLTVLSLSHVVELDSQTSITCTAVCLLDENETFEHIAKMLEAENANENTTLYCFENAFKVSVYVGKIHYN